MNEFICPSCKYEKISRGNPALYFLGCVSCPNCKGEVAPAVKYEVFYMVVAPIISCITMILLLENYSLKAYLLASVIFSGIFLYFLYRSPIRVVEDKKVLGQKVAFGPTRSGVIGLIVVYGFGALLWVV